MKNLRKLAAVAVLAAFIVGCSRLSDGVPEDAKDAAITSPKMASTGGPYALLLSTTLSSVATTVTVTDGSYAPLGSPAFVIGIDTEKLYVTAISGNSWTATRGYGGTSAAAHTPWVPVTILSGSGGAASGTTWQTVTSGQTATLLPTDGVRFDTTAIGDAGAATAVLPSIPTSGEIHTGCWISWEAGASPIIQASAVDGGAVMQPFTGQSASGVAGMTTWTKISTPGACPSWKYDGSEWVLQ